MSPLLDVQRRGQQIGRIRIGQQVAVIKDGRDTGKTRPARLDTFRFTTGSETVAQAIAAYYGGEVRPWNGEYEVITGKDVIGVTVPPRDEVISQWYEMWTKGGCQRRCDSRREQISGGQCLCPHAEDPGDHDEVTRMALERSRLASLNPPRACKAVTRVNVGIPDLPGLGVFRLDTGSYYAAVEMGDAAQLMQMARDHGVTLPAQLRIDHRSRVANGETKKFPVPVLEVMATVRDLVTGALEAGGMAAQLPPAPGEQPRGHHRRNAGACATKTGHRARPPDDRAADRRRRHTRPDPGADPAAGHQGHQGPVHGRPGVPRPRRPRRVREPAGPADRPPEPAARRPATAPRRRQTLGRRTRRGRGCTVTLSISVIRASTPWEGTGGKPVIPSKGEAPRREVAYVCAKRHRMILPFAAEATVPDCWDCRHCGQPARREGAPEGTAARPHLPGLKSGAGRHDRQGSGDVTPMGQLRKRRTRKQGEAILAEALERARQTGAAR